MPSNTSTSRPEISRYYQELAEAGRTIAERATADQYVARLGEAHTGINELNQWHRAIVEIGHKHTLQIVVQQYQYAIHAATQGLYRACYGALRLSLEFSFATIQFSTDDLSFRKWSRGDEDILWARLTNEDTGVSSEHYAKCYGEPLTSHLPTFRGRAKRAYRGYSEYIHANANTHHLPSALSFDEERYLEFLACLKEFHEVVNFFLLLRFGAELGDAERRLIEEHVLERLGHLPEVRRYFEECKS